MDAKLIETGEIAAEDDDYAFALLAEYFHAQGCKKFAIEDGYLWLMWPDGTQQKVEITKNETIQ